MIGFVESVSVAQTLAAKKRQRIVPDQELIGLGASNVAASVTGGYPVTGGFARSVVNFDAGAETPAAGAFTAVGIGLATLLLTPLLYYLPTATLAATIIVAVLSLVDFSILGRTWRYSKADFAAVAATIGLTLGLGVEIGVSAGVALSILLFLLKTSRPHIAEVGLIAGTQHFRNVRRHKVLTSPNLLTLRVDESLYFANARYLEDVIYDRAAADPAPALAEAATAEGSFMMLTHQKIDPEGAATYIASLPEAEQATVAGVYGESGTAQRGAGRDVLRYAVRFPAILLVVFGAIAPYFRSKGGYKPIELTEGEVA